MIKKFLKMFLAVFMELIKEHSNDDIEIPKMIKIKKNNKKKKETLEELIIRFSRKMPLGDNKKNLALLKAIIQQESGFKIRATSVCGARGLLQLMPSLGGLFGKTPEELYNPETNLKIGVSHFKSMYNYFKNIKEIERIKLAVAAYNCGRCYISSAIKILKEKNMEIKWVNITKYLKVAKHKGKIADYIQVTNYVRKVMRNYKKNLI